jgi:hypothetical protein
MCTQTFFQLFIFSNNQKKMENKSLIFTGPARENDRPTSAFGLAKKGQRRLRLAAR